MGIESESGETEHHLESISKTLKYTYYILLSIFVLIL